MNHMISRIQSTYHDQGGWFCRCTSWHRGSHLIRWPCALEVIADWLIGWLAPPRGTTMTGQVEDGFNKWNQCPAFIWSKPKSGLKVLSHLSHEALYPFISWKHDGWSPLYPLYPFISWRHPKRSNTSRSALPFFIQPCVIILGLSALIRCSRLAARSSISLFDMPLMLFTV